MKREGKQKKYVVYLSVSFIQSRYISAVLFIYLIRNINRCTPIKTFNNMNIQLKHSNIFSTEQMRQTISKHASEIFRLKIINLRFISSKEKVINKIINLVWQCSIERKTLLHRSTTLLHVQCYNLCFHLWFCLHY